MHNLHIHSSSASKQEIIDFISFYLYLVLNQADISKSSQENNLLNTNMYDELNNTLNKSMLTITSLNNELDKVQVSSIDTRGRK